MEDINYTTKILNQFQISSPPDSLPTKHLPLTFLDYLWILCRPIRRLLFFKFPHSTKHFLDSVIPTLKHSLSLSLQHFYPLAGQFILPPHPNTPYILYTPKHSVSLTVAESTGDFNHLIADYPRDAKHLYPFVPDLPDSRVLPDGSRALPNLALQITVFPNQGVCICIAFNHVAADGMSINNFIKSWGSISSGSFSGPLPCHDRAAVKDPDGLESIFLEELSGWDSVWNPVPEKPIIDLAPVDKVRATLVLTKPQMEKLKTWVLVESRKENDLIQLRLSSFIVTCSLVWSCMIKSTEMDEHDKLCYLAFLANCRNRLKDPLPATYFGNCLDMGVVALKKSELLKRNSVVNVAKVIGKRVEEFESEPLKMAREWLKVWRSCSEAEHLLTVAGSPKLRSYDTDFGWGRPVKTEVLHVDSSLAISLHETRDGEGGIEIGLGLHSSQMKRFLAIWEDNFKSFL